jgi:uncharacterized protein YndB with AHSA1/START domain
VTSRVVVSLRVATTPARAFEAFTQDIGIWWVDSDFFRFTPRSPGVMAFEAPAASGEGGRLTETLPNGKVFEVGDIRVWAPGERLVVGWRQATFAPDHATEVEVRFEPVGKETRITVEHRGWDSVPQDHVARHGFALSKFQQRQGQHWQVLLTSLSSRLGATHD